MLPDIIRNKIIELVIDFWNWLQIAFAYAISALWVIMSIWLILLIIHENDKENGKY